MHRVPLLSALRATTTAQHAALDAAFAGALIRERYVGFLRASLAVLSALEPALVGWQPGRAAGRCDRLRADLAALGAAADAAAVDAGAPGVALTSLAASYGAAYVVEGSTLGGMVLAERFEAALALPRDQATAFLRLRGRDTAARWRGFLDELARADAAMADGERAAACAAASQTFEAYAHAMRAHRAFGADA